MFLRFILFVYFQKKSRVLQNVSISDREGFCLVVVFPKMNGLKNYKYQKMCRMNLNNRFLLGSVSEHGIQKSSCCAI